MQLERQLRRAGFRVTRARRVVAAALATAGRPLSPAEVLAAARRGHPGLGRATVYRTLNLLVRVGLVVPRPGPGGVRYSLASEGMHRLVCRNCGAERLLADCPAGGLAEELARRYGFQVEGHLLEFYGLCPDCRRRAKP